MPTILPPPRDTIGESLLQFRRANTELAARFPDNSHEATIHFCVFATEAITEKLRREEVPKMFDRFKGTAATVMAPHQYVKAFNDLVAERGAARTKVSKLEDGAEQTQARLAAIPEEVKTINDNHYRNVVQREVDSTKPDLTEHHNALLAALTTEQGTLQMKRAAFRTELDGVNRTLTRAERNIDLSRRMAWQVVAEQLSAEVSPEFQRQFLRIYTAWDRVHDGIRIETVLGKITAVDVTNETKLGIIDALREEFQVDDEYQ